MAVSLPDARELSDEVLEALRLRAVRGCELGFTEADVADLLGVCRETVSRWWSAYARDGLDALPHDRTGRPTGTGRILSDQQAEQIRAQLDAHRPEDLGIPAPLWTRPAVQQLIRNALGIAMPVRLRAHGTPAVADWVAAHRDRIELFYLPRYAPELNATEYLNNDLKGRVNEAGLPNTKGELRSRMQRFMNKLRWLPGHVRNYFKHPCMLYAMAA